LACGAARCGRSSAYWPGLCATSASAACSDGLSLKRCSGQNGRVAWRPRPVEARLLPDSSSCSPSRAYPRTCSPTPLGPASSRLVLSWSYRRWGDCPASSAAPTWGRLSSNRTTSRQSSSFLWHRYCSLLASCSTGRSTRPWRLSSRRSGAPGDRPVQPTGLRSINDLCFLPGSAWRVSVAASSVPISATLSVPATFS